MSQQNSGYKGAAKKLLEGIGADIGDQIRVINEKSIYEGILIPRSEYGDDKHVIVKLKSGYNIGIETTQRTKIERIGAKTKPSFVPPSPPVQKSSLPRVTILSTGGTIASRVDYRTGAVRPAISASDLYSIIPELSDIAIIDARILFSVFSEDLTVAHWKRIAEATAEQIRKGVDGVVVTHGTDTMGYTAAALSFALSELPVPVIIVGAQRSEDRPSSDAATNMIGAVLAAGRAPFAEVAVAMHETISDEAIVLHRATKVRKCHTSRRDAFKTVNARPIARILNSHIDVLANDLRQRDCNRKVTVKPCFNEKVTIVKSHPGLSSEILDWLVDKGNKGVVLEGTGLGHIRQEFFTSIRRAIDQGVVVGMTSQCIWGRVNMNVYTNGRDLIALGVIPLEDMLTETAFVKMMWVLGQTDNLQEIRNLLAMNIAGEISKRTVESVEPPTTIDNALEG